MKYSKPNLTFLCILICLLSIGLLDRIQMIDRISPRKVEVNSQKKGSQSFLNLQTNNKTSDKK